MPLSVSSNTGHKPKHYALNMNTAEPFPNRLFVFLSTLKERLLKLKRTVVDEARYFKLVKIFGRKLLILKREKVYF